MHSDDRRLFAVAVPAFAALIAEPAMILADTVIVGRLGAVELAALAAGSTVLLTIVGLCIFLAYGTTASVARHHGARDDRRAVEVGFSGVWLALGLGLVLAALVAVCARQLATWLSSSPAVAEAATEYVRVAAFSIPAMLVVFACTGALRGVLDLRSPLVAMVGATIVNIALTWWFVHGLAWGMTGAAAGLVLAQAGAAAWLVGRLVMRGRRLGSGLRPRAREILVAAADGVPLFVRTVTLRAALVLATLVAAGLGDAPLAAHQIATAIVTFLAFALDALAIAAQTLTGQSLGAGDAKRTRDLTRRVIGWGFVSGVALAVVVAVASPWIARAFTTDPDVLDVVVPALLVVALIQPVSGVVFVLDGVLIGAGDGRFLAVAGLITLVVYAPVAWTVGALGASFTWLWAAYCVFQGARFATLWWRQRGDRWLVTGASIR